MQKDFQVVATFEPNIKTEKNLNKLPNEVLYVIAKGGRLRCLLT